MDLIKKHIQPCLSSFVNENSSNTDLILNNIQNPIKVDYIQLIRYLDKIINETFIFSNETLCALHIHLEDEFTDSQKLLIAEYLLVKTFKHYQSIDIKTNQFNSSLNELKVALKAMQKKLEMKCPDGASAKKGGNKIWKNWLQDKKRNKSLLEFYKNLNENSSLKPKSIFNTQKNFCSSISQIFELRPFTVILGSKYISYNLLNATLTLNEIDEIDNEIIDELESIVLFDCERKSLMVNFSFEEINKWNSDYGTTFKKYLIFTFGKDHHSLNSFRSKIETIRERFKIPADTTYTLLASEIGFFLNKKEKSPILIEFAGFNSSSFWDTFVLETSIRELYELRSIKLLNVYSICFTQEIKSYILENLFSNSESSELISSNTKMAILELRDENLSIIKEALSATLDLIINSGIKSKIIEQLNNTPTIILDEAIIRNAKLKSKFSKALNLTRSIKIKPWLELTNSTSINFLILSYRDQGKYPNYYFPNLLEFEYQNKKMVKAVLPNFLFGHHYKWSKYYLLKEYHKYLSHPIRQNHFEWNKLKNSIQAQKPESKLYINWNLENEFSSSDNRESYKIKTFNQRAKIHHSSDLLVFSEKTVQKPRIERVKWVFENVDFDEIKHKVQKLDELLDEFNPAERLIDTTQQELELEIIRKQLGLGNETAGRIWKVLLRKKSELIGSEALYEELKNIFSKNNIPLVRPSYFTNSWLNTESDSLMPRGNKVFKILCDYLNLNNNYRLILYRLKNTSISGKIEATKKYSNLLKDLFSDGCFDSDVSIKILLQPRIKHYRNNHPLEELGINNEDPIGDLVTLIELIQPELKLLELETIEKIEQ